MRNIKIGDFEISQLIMGGNPFSGFSHQGPERDREMKAYYTVENIKGALRRAESAGVNTLLGRGDRHVRRMLGEYWNEGGQIQWIGQTASEYGDQVRAALTCLADGAIGAYLHGGIVDNWFANGQTDNIREVVDAVRSAGGLVGLAAHKVEAHEWIRDNLELDFEMVCYYNPSDRSASPHHVASHGEVWDRDHRDRVMAYIKSAPWPVIHYKVFAAANLPIDEGWQVVAENLRENDMVCIGHYIKENPDMIAENVATLERLVGK